MAKPKKKPSSGKPRNNRKLLSTRNVETEKAINQVILWMIAGNRGEDIKEALSKEFPSQDEGKVIASAAEHFKKLANSNDNVLRGWCLDATRDIYQKMVSIGDFSGALKAIKQLNEFNKK